MGRLQRVSTNPRALSLRRVVGAAMMVLVKRGGYTVEGVVSVLQAAGVRGKVGDPRYDVLGVWLRQHSGIVDLPPFYVWQNHVEVALDVRDWMVGRDSVLVAIPDVLRELTSAIDDGDYTELEVAVTLPVEVRTGPELDMSIPTPPGAKLAETGWTHPGEEKSDGREAEAEGAEESAPDGGAADA